MSCSKPLPPFVCDLLYYLNRDQLERFSIICRPLKNFIERYFNSKPYRVFDELRINGGSYALCHNRVQWHPNRADYSVQQFLGGQKCSVDKWKYYWTMSGEFFSFAEMRPYLSPTVRIRVTTILVDASSFIYSPEHVTEMESLTYLWRDHKIYVRTLRSFDSRIGAEDFQLILNSPNILQCQEFSMTSPSISFKDYEVLYAVKIFRIYYVDCDIDNKYLASFLEEPGLKPIVSLHISGNKMIDKLLDRLSKDFSSADSSNTFKIAIYFNPCFKFGPLTEFQKTNNTLSEKLELKKGLPTGYQAEDWDKSYAYTLERSMI